MHSFSCSHHRAAADPCACTADGLSGDVQTDVVGCSIETFFGTLCYVQDPGACEDSFPSTNFEGAAYKKCD